MKVMITTGILKIHQLCSLDGVSLAEIFVRYKMVNEGQSVRCHF